MVNEYAPMTIAEFSVINTPPLIDPAHICGTCRTPFGRSALPCPNEASMKGRRR